ncbi:MAG: YchJ family protein [Sedimenticola sp.]|nr:YchJ family protein [Sedimenticola sp.]
MSSCPCGSELPAESCCLPILQGELKAPTAERLMRARYCAFARGEIDFLSASLHPDHRSDHDVDATRRWAESAQWQGLQIVDTDAGGEGDSEGLVEFVATFKEKDVVRQHHERSRFSRFEGDWYFVDGEMVLPATRVNPGPKVGRNDPCPCGSGKKYKKCCGR